MDLLVIKKEGAGRYGARGADAQLVVGAIFALLGLCFLLAGLGSALWITRFLNSSTQAQGVVDQLRTVEDPIKHTLTYAPVFHFTANNGRSYIIDSTNSSNPASFAPGDRIRVLYDPADPGGAKIDSLWQLWGTAMIFGGLGFIFTVLGGGLLWIAWRQKRRKARTPTAYLP